MKSGCVRCEEVKIGDVLYYRNGWDIEEVKIKTIEVADKGDRIFFNNVLYLHPLYWDREGLVKQILEQAESRFEGVMEETYKAVEEYTRVCEMYK